MFSLKTFIALLAKTLIVVLIVVAIIVITVSQFALGDGPRPLSGEDQQLWKALNWDFALAQRDAAPYQERLRSMSAELTKTFAEFQEKYDAPANCSLLPSAAWECKEPEPAEDTTTSDAKSQTIK